MTRFTEIQLKAKIKKLSEELKKEDIRDKTFAIEDGLSMRVFRNGRNSFQYRYKLPKAQNKKRVVYGDYPAISLKEAREKHTEARKQVRSGIDISLEKTLEIQKRIEDPTINQAYERYKEGYLIKELKRPERQFYLFEKDILPAIGKMKVKDMKRPHLVAVLDKIKHRGSPIQANRTLSALKTFFNYCVESGLLDDNPAAKISKKFVGGSEKPRKRFLTESEIKTFLEKLDTAPFSRQAQLVLKILLLAGQRVGEVCNAEWSEIDFKKGIWTIPSEKAKNGEENRVPLHYEAQLCFSELSVLARKSRFVCQSPQITDDERAILYTTVNRAVKRHQTHFEIEQWTPHDLRRTVATHLNELGVMPHVVEKILNHKMQGVMAVYNQADYWEERVKALEIWQERIKQIVSSEKVIPIRKKEA
jgi:integrase